MGDISIIARRLRGGYVQYGWSGNGGYFRNVGRKLLDWYDTPEMVEYLFELGQVSLLGAPHSEKGGYSLMLTTRCTGSPHHLGNTERKIFSQIAFIDYGYFYDLDRRWYFVKPGPFRIKYPLALLANVVDSGGDEFEFIHDTGRQLLEYILGEYRKKDSAFQELLAQEGLQAEEVLKTLLADDYPIHKFFEHYEPLFRYFDDWVVVETDENFTEVIGFQVCKAGEVHVETIERSAGEEQ